MSQKVFNFGGTDQEYQAFKENVGNISAYLTSVIRSKIPKNESAVVALCRSKLQVSQNELENNYTKIEVLRNEIDSLKDKIEEEEAKHQIQVSKDAQAYAKDKIKMVKASVDAEYKYICSMKAKGFTGTLDEFLVLEYYDNLE